MDSESEELPPPLPGPSWREVWQRLLNSVAIFACGYGVLALVMVQDATMLFWLAPLFGGAGVTVRETLQIVLAPR